MRIAFHGAARTVTGSKHLVTLDSGTKILLDCGMFQGMGKDTEPLNEYFGFDPKEVDCLVLSHAHIDHSGLIPRLVKEGFRGDIFCTEGTKDFVGILLEDSARIQEDDAHYENKHRSRRGLDAVAPLYTTADAVKALELIKTVAYNEWYRINQEAEVLFTDAGHIIGSAAVHLRFTEHGVTQQLSFSGDVGRYNDAILQKPDTFPQADYLLLESTYGNSLHGENFRTIDTLSDWIEQTCRKAGGKLIIPAFSVGRTQELLFFLNQLSNENRLGIPVIVDSPLSSEATDIVRQHPENFNQSIRRVLKYDDDAFDFKELRFTHSVEDSKALNKLEEPCIIISASGMADAGRIRHHIANNLHDARNTILIVGYCEPSSLGGRLARGANKVTIFGEEHEVKAQVGKMDSMSAHGDYNDLLQFLSCQDAGKIKELFLVHGEYEVQQAFAERLTAKGFKVTIPEQHVVYGLNSQAVESE
jgi:metallo-beta-lactamase family protein